MRNLFISMSATKDGIRYFIKDLYDDLFSLEFNSLKEAKTELKRLEKWNTVTTTMLLKTLKF